MYHILDHTADIGIKVESPTLSELFTESAGAMFGLMFRVKRDDVPPITVPISLEAPFLEQLYVRWLQELLFVFETRRLVLSKFFVDEVDGHSLTGSAMGRKFDSTRHEQLMEIKAVTYHQIEVKQQASGLWLARVIFDL